MTSESTFWSQSPELNPIAMLWNDVKRDLNMSELKWFCEEECSKIAAGRCGGLIHSYCKQLLDAFVAKGGSTSYLNNVSIDSSIITLYV